MSKPLLSILIPTVVGREENLKSLLRVIKGDMAWTEVFLSDGVYDFHYGSCKSLPLFFEVTKDNKEKSIGDKREYMYQHSNGLYSFSIDDDDNISGNAIQLMLEAIKSNPEIPCITFREKCMMNGEYKSSNHSIKYDKWQDNFDGYDYVRCPFYKDVIRTDIAKSVPFPHIRYNEDEQWSMAIKPFLTDEIHIDEELYYYIYEPKEDFNTRYGINPVS